MKADTIGIIEDLFEYNRRVFKIPVYQRDYDWAAEDCKKLFNDILNAFKKNEEHFLGTFLYMVIEDTSKLKEALIIDGQQRFTTIYLLLKALENTANKNKIDFEEIKDSLYNRYADNKFKLISNEKDNKELENLMSGRVEDMSPNSNITINYNLFMNLIQDYKHSPKEIFEGLKKLRAVEIVLDKSKGDNPQAIFESINSTGVKLSLADLVKNFLLMDEKNQDRLFKEYWLKMENQLQNKNIENFIIHYLNSNTTKSITKTNAYDSFKEFYKNHFKSNEDALKELCKFSRYYSNFLGIRKDHKSEVIKALKNLVILDQTTPYPFLLKIFEQHEERNIDDDELENIVNFLVMYHVRRMVCGVPSNSLKNLYKSLFKSIKNNNNYFDNLVVYLSSTDSRNKIPSDEEFKDSLKYTNLYRNKKLCRFFLASIENSNSKEQISIDENITIEHIMPQNIKNSKEWKNELGDNFKDIHEKYLNTLGNLTFTGYNSELGNKPFNEKKDIIKEHSKFNILNENILNEGIWNNKSIEKRANFLVEKLMTIFKYDKPNLNEEDSNEFILGAGRDTFANYKPKKFIFLDNEVDVSSSVQMLDEFIKILYDLNPIFLDVLAKENFKMSDNPTAAIYMSYNKEFMRRPKSIGNSGIWYESNLSTDSILNFIEKLLDKSDEYEPENFKFEMEPPVES